MNDEQMDAEEKKSTSEKPVALKPLSFKDALLGLLRVKPKPKEEDREEDELEENSADK